MGKMGDFDDDDEADEEEGVQRKRNRWKPIPDDCSTIA
jgi:hypothetical protein